MAASAVEGAAVSALRSVMQRVRQAAERSGRPYDRVRVVAVGKTKPLSLIRELYDAGHRCFGENYVQEFVDKAPQLPQDIEWHFIGHLQSNKVKALLGMIPSGTFSLVISKQSWDSFTNKINKVDSLLIAEWLRAYCQFCKTSAVPNLNMVEGLDNEKIANHLDRGVANIGRKPLKVMVQVNTSGEATKSGVDPTDCVELVKHVKHDCPNLEFSGLMTIGMPDYSSTPENFRALSKCRAEVCKALGITEEQCELSMGMSGDFEQAIELGSTNVRIGSTIFGPREYPKKDK